MDQDTAIVLSSNRELTPAIWQMISQMAPVMHKSRLFGVSSEEQAAAIMLKGYELGMSITASFELIQVIQGKPGLSPRGALALLHNSPEIEAIKITRLAPGGIFQGYQCYMKRKTGFEYTAQWTMDDAKRAGLVKPDSGWANYPENMCLWRAVGFCADMVAPDITAGLTGIMKAPEAYGVALTTDGDVIDAIPVETTVQPAMVTLDDLLGIFDPSSIMAANNGKIPGTDDEVQAVAKTLCGGAS